jgi:uncharacterized protein (TIGR02145 family)
MSGARLALALLACGACGGAALRDVDGHRYRAVRLGRQTWMAENLRATRAPEGATLATRAPHDAPANVAAYGLLYDWDAARRACPSGWHLPTDAEWAALERELGPRAGGALKATTGWRPPNAGASDAAGFGARPAGYANDAGFDDQFGARAVFWTATRADEHFAWSRVLSFDSDEVRRAPQHPQYGFSVRCVTDRP